MSGPAGGRGGHIGKAAGVRQGGGAQNRRGGLADAGFLLYTLIRGAKTGRVAGMR
jgi:hypothetical protein